MPTAPAQASIPAPRIAAEAVRQHVEIAAFLWAQRDTLSLDDPVGAGTIGDIDQRVEANLDGLRIAGPAAWPAIDTIVDDFPENGELFVAAWMAIEQSDPQRLEKTVDLAHQFDQPRGLVGALAWHTVPKIAPLARDWLGERNGFKRYLGVAACAEHNVDPKQWLERLVCDPDPRVRAIALRLAGMLGRADLAAELRDALDADNESVRLWAAWALTEVGRGNLASAALRKAAVAGGPDALFALRAAVKAGPEKDVRAWMGELMRTPATAPVAVRGVGMLGERSVLPWLIERMREPQVAVAAVAAFLELFPEAREETKLFTVDPEELGPAFDEHFKDDVTPLALPDSVAAWLAGRPTNGGTNLRNPPRSRI
jgi:uncharacterized protein (TIGR02270 family)